MPQASTTTSPKLQGVHIHLLMALKAQQEGHWRNLFYLGVEHLFLPLIRLTTKLHPSGGRNPTHQRDLPFEINIHSMGMGLGCFHKGWLLVFHTHWSEVMTQIFSFYSAKGRHCCWIITKPTESLGGSLNIQGDGQAQRPGGLIILGTLTN